MKVNLDKNSYDIIIERGALAHIGDYLNLQRKVLVVTDSGVPAQYARAVADASKSAFVVTVPQGEGSKSIREWETLLEKMLENEFTRSDAVVAVGGGVVGDLAGFAAASYMRGVDFYNIPTTLLSQVDSSVGGKTAVNFGGIKNVVGAFYQPKKVVIDSEVLATLEPRQTASGMAEAIKMALCFDSSLFEKIENSAPYEDIDSIIAASIAIKAKVVEQDEKEAGLRRVLNFGHTIGHGIEAQGGLYHGECVALGMLPMCSEAVRARLVPVLERYGLPTTYSADPQAVLGAIAHDKKRAGDKINIVRVDTIGSFEIQKVSLEALSKLV
ncbi:MAG: 3-dehydroquinate synthase [Clostridia bacterium]|nr:3-dehydroquinate synthase [Clostridia bacterium]